MPEPPIVWPPKVDETSAKKASSLRKQSPSQNHDNDNDNDDDDAPLERVGIWAAARKKNSSSSSSSSGGGESGQGKDDNDNDNDDSLLLEVPFSREAGFQLPLEGDLSISVSTSHAQCVNHNSSSKQLAHFATIHIIKDCFSCSCACVYNYTTIKGEGSSRVGNAPFAQDSLPSSMA